MKLSKRHTVIVADIALFFIFMGLVVIFLDTGVEDAKINYRCVRNFVRESGMGYSAGEFVEGSSCLAWTIALSGLYYLGLDVFVAGHYLVMVFSAAFFILLRHVSRILFLPDSWRARLPLLGMVCITCIPASFGNMLEGAGVAFVVAMLAWGIVKRNWLILAVAASALMPLRPEGPAFAVLIGMWLIVEVNAKRISSVSMWKYMGVTECALLTLILFRFWYFGDIFPNPVRAKGPAPVDSSGFFLFGRYEYSVEYIVKIGIVLVLLGSIALFHRKTRSFALAFLGLASLNLYIVGARGDWMVHYRLLTPYTQLLLLAAVLGISLLDAAPKIVGIAAAGVFVCSLFHALSPEDISVAWRGFEIQRILPKRVFNSQFAVTETALARTLLNLDLARPDDLAVVESGGADGSTLDGVPTIEMYGLTDRKLCTEWPGTHDYQLGGVINWKYVFFRKPTFLSFCGGLTYFTREMLHYDAGAAMLNDFVACRGRTYGFTQTLVRTDREILPLFEYAYGDFCPPRDYRHYPEGVQLDANEEERTPWQLVPWRFDDGVNANDWRLWDDNLRVSALFDLKAGHATITKALWDPAPLVLLFGVREHEPVKARIGVFSNGIRGNSPVATVFIAGNDSTQFQVSGVALAPERFAGASELRLEADVETAGILYIAAYRWGGASPPVLPSAFARTRWENEVRYFAGSGDRISEALARGFLAHFETTPAATVEARLLHRREINRGVLPWREKVKTSSADPEACDGLDDYYLQCGDLETRSLEWKALTEWAPQNPEMWLRRAMACFDNGEYAACFDAAAELLGIISVRHPLQEKLIAALHRFASALSETELKTSGKRCLQRSDLPALRRLFETALPACPTVPAAVAGIAQSTGYTPEALRMYTLTALKYPQYKPIYPLMDSLCATRYGEHRNQMQWQRFLQRVTDVPCAWIALSESSERLGDCYGAFDAIRHVRDIAPQDETFLAVNDRLTMKCLLGYAKALIEKGNPGDAAKELLSFLDKHPEDFEALKILAQAYLAMDRWDDATALYRASIQRNARDYKPFDALSELYVAKGDLAGLLEEWRVFTGNVPESHLGWFCLGLALERNKRYAEAKAAYQRGVSLEPAAAGTLEALARVENLLRQSGGAPR